MANSRPNLPAQVIDIRPRDGELYAKWKHKNTSVTPTDNTHFVFATKEEEIYFIAISLILMKKKNFTKNIELPGGKELLNTNMVMLL
ncbi:hypothetical protein OAB92_01950 [Candidatus Pelagibacter sp.]|nr:hypothetical protein [Candidatus Pelagibacter sp.]